MVARLAANFLTYELWRNIFRQIYTPTLAEVLLAQHIAVDAITTHILADDDKLHLRGEAAGAGIVQLGHALASLCFARQR